MWSFWDILYCILLSWHSTQKSLTQMVSPYLEGVSVYVSRCNSEHAYFGYEKYLNKMAFLWKRNLWQQIKSSKDTSCHLANTLGCLLSKMWSCVHFRASKNVINSQENRCVMPYEILKVLILWAPMWLVKDNPSGGVAKCNCRCNSEYAHDVGEKYL